VLDSVVRSLGSLVVDETVALGLGHLVNGNLAAENWAKSGKGVVKCLVVNGRVQVLDEDVALTSFAKSRVALRPHDAARLPLDQGIVQFFKRAFAVHSAVVVDIGIAKRTTGNGVTADTDGSDLTDGREKLEEHGLGDREVELSNVERGGVLVSGGRSGGVRGSDIFGARVLVGDVGVDGGAIGSRRSGLLSRSSNG